MFCPLSTPIGAVALVAFVAARNLFADCDFVNNTADSGGAVFVGESGGNFTDCIFEDNVAGTTKFAIVARR